MRKGSGTCALDRRALLGAIVSLALAGCRKRKTVRTPSRAAGWVETGIASWYGRPYHGRPTASGEIYDMEKMTAAHRTLPFGTWVEVTNLKNQRKVRVRINDRGPFVEGRIIDLSLAAARELGMVSDGIVRVRLEVISAPGGTVVAGPFGVQVGAYMNRDRAERMYRTLRRSYAECRLVKREGPTVVWRVLIGREATLDGAQDLAERLRAEFGPVFVVRLDE